MSQPAFALFDTPIGRCGIAWRQRGIVALYLPEASDAALRARLAAQVRDSTEMPPPPAIAAAIAAIRALLSGEPHDLRELTLDMTDVPPFHRRVYETAREIPPGQTLTYGE